MGARRKSQSPSDVARASWPRRPMQIIFVWPLRKRFFPSPLGRGCPATGAFTSQSGTGEGSVAR
jgi:hypothetical protein